MMPPTLANRKVYYIELPADDVHHSARFCKEVSGGLIRQRGDGHVAFDDTTGEVSGTWVTGRQASQQPGLLLYIMVDNVAAAIDMVIAHGGEVVQPIGADALGVTARFRDPAGNVIGFYQEPGAAEEQRSDG